MTCIGAQWDKPGRDPAQLLPQCWPAAWRRCQEGTATPASSCFAEEGVEGLNTLGCPAERSLCPAQSAISKLSEGDAWSLLGSTGEEVEKHPLHTDLSALQEYTSAFQKIESNGMEIWLSDYGYCSVDLLPGVSSRREINLYYLPLLRV